MSLPKPEASGQLPTPKALYKPLEIKLLPEHLIDQIKAGEVVERPSSLIKELIENSIDAHANKIEIQILDNGLELISIEDNGDGISFQDLPFAFCRHATSKIDKFEDLYNLNSFGFRGEALASIASSSKLVCQSTHLQSNTGGKIEINGGKQISLSPIMGDQSGTSFYIRDLFYNTPVRLKFIKSKQAEKNSLKRILNSFLISNPNITFTIRWEDKEKIIYKSIKENKIEKRLTKIFFNNKKDSLPLHYFEGSYEGNKIWGYISHESSKGNSHKSHFLFANNRLFSDRALHQTILRSAKNIWKDGQVGHYAIFISTPPNEIDVNVHPNKIQVKFFKNSTIFSLLGSSISNSIDQKVINKLNSSNPEASNQASHPLSVDSSIAMNGQGLIKKIPAEEAKGFFISNRFSFINYQDHKLMVDHYKLYLSYWSHLLDQTLPPRKEQDMSPLLIAEPFYLARPFNQYQDLFLKKGFEFERIEDDLLILKTVPLELYGFQLNIFITPYISLLIKEQGHMEELERSNPTCFSSITEVHSILKTNTLEAWKEKKAISYYNQNKFLALF